MKVQPITSYRVNFKGILCPNNYSKTLKECIDEVIPPFKEVIIVSEAKSPVKKLLHKIFDIKPKVKVEQHKSPYHFGGYLFLQDPLGRKTKLEPGVFKCDYDVWCHSIYKDNSKPFYKTAAEEEKTVFELLKKKISGTMASKDNETLSDEFLFKNHAIALIDDNNILSTMKIRSELINNLKNIL